MLALEKEFPRELKRERLPCGFRDGRGIWSVEQPLAEAEDGPVLTLELAARFTPYTSATACW
jgi:hypothetical protein